MKRFNKKAEALWLDKIVADYKVIEVEPGTCRYNYQCCHNAINDAIKNGDKKIAVCFYDDGNTVTLHFINYHKGKFIDNTLGYWSTHQKYYFYRWIESDQFGKETIDIFRSIRRKFNKMIPWYWRFLVKNEV